MQSATTHRPFWPARMLRPRRRGDRITILPKAAVGTLFARIDNCGAKVLFEAATGRFLYVIGGNTILCRSAYAFGYSLVELFKHAQFRIDVGLSPAFEELKSRFRPFTTLPARAYHIGGRC